MMSIERLTKDATGKSWVDNVPGGISTGYQAQNTNLEAQAMGLDNTKITLLTYTQEVIVKVEIGLDSLFEFNRMIWKITSPMTLSVVPPSSGVSYYHIYVVPGDQGGLGLRMISQSPYWEPTKNGWYSFVDGDLSRALNTIVIVDANGGVVSVRPYIYGGEYLGRPPYFFISTLGEGSVAIPVPGYYRVTAIGGGGRGGQGSNPIQNYQGTSPLCSSGGGSGGIYREYILLTESSIFYKVGGEGEDSWVCSSASLGGKGANGSPGVSPSGGAGGAGGGSLGFAGAQGGSGGSGAYAGGGGGAGLVFGGSGGSRASGNISPPPRNGASGNALGLSYISGRGGNGGPGSIREPSTGGDAADYGSGGGGAGGTPGMKTAGRGSQGCVIIEYIGSTLPTTAQAVRSGRSTRRAPSPQELAEQAYHRRLRIDAIQAELEPIRALAQSYQLAGESFREAQPGLYARHQRLFEELKILF